MGLCTVARSTPASERQHSHEPKARVKAEDDAGLEPEVRHFENGGLLLMGHIPLPPSLGVEKFHALHWIRPAQFENLADVE